jgi:hypothetical protein
MRLKICGGAGRPPGRHALLSQRKAGTRMPRMFRIDDPLCLLLDSSPAKRLLFLFHVLRPFYAPAEAAGVP